MDGLSAKRNELSSDNHNDNFTQLNESHALRKTKGGVCEHNKMIVESAVKVTEARGTPSKFRGSEMPSSRPLM